MGLVWCQFGADLGSIWGHFGANLGPISDQFGANLGPSWGQVGVQEGGTPHSYPQLWGGYVSIMVVAALMDRPRKASTTSLGSAAWAQPCCRPDEAILCGRHDARHDIQRRIAPMLSHSQAPTAGPEGHPQTRACGAAASGAASDALLQSSYGVSFHNGARRLGLHHHELSKHLPLARLGGRLQARLHHADARQHQFPRTFDFLARRRNISIHCWRGSLVPPREPPSSSGGVYFCGPQGATKIYTTTAPGRSPGGAQGQACACSSGELPRSTDRR